MTDPNKAVDYIIKSAPKFAQAKADRVFTENFLRSKKALLMNQSNAKTIAEREQFAYSHPEYVELLNGLRVAVEIEEKLKWDLIAAQTRCEIWRTEQANNRAQDRATQ